MVKWTVSRRALPTSVAYLTTESIDLLSAHQQDRTGPPVLSPLDDIQCVHISLVLERKSLLGCVASHQRSPKEVPIHRFDLINRCFDFNQQFLPNAATSHLTGLLVIPTCNYPTAYFWRNPQEPLAAYTLRSTRQLPGVTATHLQREVEMPLILRQRYQTWDLAHASPRNRATPASSRALINKRNASCRSIEG